jgi:hypothetical protein
MPPVISGHHGQSRSIRGGVGEISSVTKEMSFGRDVLWKRLLGHYLPKILAAVLLISNSQAAITFVTMIGLLLNQQFFLQA